MRYFAKVLVIVALVTPGMGIAQSDETLADIRQELSVLYVELQKLKRELSTTGSAGEVAAGSSLLERVGAIESELQRLTSKTEQLEFRIDRVVTDGTNRVGDLAFRLCELEANCDIGSQDASEILGGEEPTTRGGSDSIGTQDDSPQLAVGEEADFMQAKAAFEAGNYADAARQFDVFRQNYPGGPMSAEAGLLRGEALEGAGQLTEAARAYLDTFSAAPQGPQAADALFHLGNALGGMGQTEDACVTLGEVEVRFPQSGAVLEAQSAMNNLGCQ